MMYVGRYVHRHFDVSKKPLGPALGIVLLMNLHQRRQQISTALWAVPQSRRGMCGLHSDWTQLRGSCRMRNHNSYSTPLTPKYMYGRSKNTVVSMYLMCEGEDTSTGCWGPECKWNSEILNLCKRYLRQVALLLINPQNRAHECYPVL
jgi:hypothetical protein